MARPMPCVTLPMVQARLYAALRMLLVPWFKERHVVPEPWSLPQKELLASVKIRLIINQWQGRL